MQYMIEKNYWVHCFKYFSFRYKEAAVHRMYYKDGIYEGQVKRSNNSQPEKHGIGIFLTNKGDMYFGEFENNLPHGDANIILSNGSFFRGSFKDGLYEGLGLFIHNDKDVYLLNFKKGILNGKVTYFPKSGKEVFILSFKDNQLRKVTKRYRLSTEQGDEAKYRVLKSMFESSQLNEILYTASDVHKIIKKVSRNRQKFINSQMIGKEFFYCGVFNNELEFEGLGLLLDLENRKIRVGDWNKQSLHGFGTLIQTKYMFKGNFLNNQLDGDILINNLETGEYKLCLYEKGIFKAVLQEGKGNYLYKGFEYFTAMDVVDELKKFPGSEFINETSIFHDSKNLGYDIANIKLKIPTIEGFLNIKGINLQESQIVIAIKSEDNKKHKSKSPFKKGKINGLDNTGSGSDLFREIDKSKSASRTGSDFDIMSHERLVSFKFLKDKQPSYIKFSPEKKYLHKKEETNQN